MVKLLTKYLDENRNKRIGKEDGHKIVLFHQPAYAERFMSVIRSNEGNLKEINDFYATLVHYTQPKLNSLQKFNEEMGTLISDLKIEFDLLNSNVKTLEKYVGFFNKRKINRQAISV